MAKQGKRAARKQTPQAKTIEVTLGDPIQAHGEQITTLVIHKPKPKDFEAMDEGKGETAKANRLLASCARIPYSSVLTMELEDYEACMDALGGLAGFLEPLGSLEESSSPSPETGTSSSD